MDPNSIFSVKLKSIGAVSTLFTLYLIAQPFSWFCKFPSKTLMTFTFHAAIQCPRKGIRQCTLLEIFKRRMNWPQSFCLVYFRQIGLACIADCALIIQVNNTIKYQTSLQNWANIFLLIFYHSNRETKIPLIANIFLSNIFKITHKQREIRMFSIYIHWTDITSHIQKCASPIFLGRHAV